MSARNKRMSDTDTSQALSAKKICIGHNTQTATVFSGLKMYVLESGMGKSRANLFKKQLEKYGAVIQQEFNSDTTHVIVEDSVSPNRICDLLHLTNPNNAALTIVKSSWASACLKEKSLLDTGGHLVDWRDTLCKKTSSAKISSLSVTSNDSSGPVTTSNVSTINSKAFPKSGEVWKPSPKKVSDDFLHIS